MINATEVRKGMVLHWNDQLWYVMNVTHNTPGNKRAIIQIKMRNLADAGSREERFSSGDKLEQAYIDQKPMEYLYRDGDDLVFQDNESFEHSSIHQDVIGGDLQWLKENTECKVSFFEGRVLGVELPPAVDLKVVETEPPLKGATVTNVYKPAKLETGGTVSVPPFIQQGEYVTVDTRDGKYLSRASG